MTEPYGRRLLPTVLHQVAKTDPDRIYCIHARSNDIDDGFYNVTFGEIARAVNWTSNWLQARFENGEKPSELPTLTFIGIPDLSYNILYMAANQCRYKVFLPSPRNPIDTNTALLERTKCNKLVFAAGVASVAKNLEQATPGLHCEELPSLQHLLNVPDTEYVYDYKYDDIYQESVLILHSSGSTGLPKPIELKHGTWAALDYRDFPTVPDRINHDGLTTLRFSQPDSRVFDVFPMFHIMGFMIKILVPVFNGTIPIFGPPLRPPSGTLATQMIRMHRPRAVCVPPSIVEQIYYEPDCRIVLKYIDIILFAGGPLSPEVGHDIAKYTQLCQFYGATEMGGVRQLLPAKADWEWFEFHPEERCALEPQGDGLSELVLFCSPDMEAHSMLYHNFPDITEHRTKDLFEQHPTKPHLWKFRGRIDDILVFSSGEKLNPIPMESYMTGVDGVAGALVVGQGFPQSALLVELTPTHQFQDAQKELWSHVEAGNAQLPGHGRVAKSMVIIADPSKPFQRAGKGTVIRRMTEKLYAEEIKEAFASKSKKEKPKPVAISLKPSAFRIEDIKSVLRAVLDQVSVPSEVGDDDNLYAYGMDSVKTAEAFGHLKATLEASKSPAELKWFTAETLYSNPTINQLATVLLAFVNEGKVPKKRDRVAEMKAKIDEMSRDLPRNLPARQVRADGQQFSVAVTGTTGFLGGHLLTKLVKNPQIGRIYCLNRSATAEKKFDELGLIHDKDMTFLQVDFTSAKLGLTDGDYAKLQEDCDLIVHNAWRIDFNISLDSFEDNLQSVKNLIALSAASPLRPRILYMSSISTTGIWNAGGNTQLTVPEKIVPDLSVTMRTGYAESKHVTEHVLNAAAQKSGIPVTIIRMGQVAPRTGEAWPENDTLPVFLKTCKAAGMLASEFCDTIDWVPVDAAAAVIDDLVEHQLCHEDEPLVRVCNVVNPQALPWSSVTETVQTWCGSKTEVMSMGQWVEALSQKDANNADEVARYPALRMLPVYEAMAKHGPMHKYAMHDLMAVSKSMSEIPPLNNQQLDSWLSQL